ncbi:MAG: NAD-dependent epimerase/dehydratase family protein [Thermoleophilia bacterium]|nr:NAD-dependent epimerase/dehydratase family protein [Thermoleophilia bacterium]
MRLVVTGAGGFLGWRTAELLEGRGHEVVRVTRPGGVRRRFARAGAEADAGDPAARRLLAGCDAVLHFAGIPDPARGRADPAWAVRMNAGTTLNLLEGCLEHGCGLVYPSTVRAADPPDPYALSKRLGEDVCRLHRAPAAVVRLTSVFGPGQVAREGATGAISSFAACALAGEPIVLPGNPHRTRDFVYVDDVVGALERLVAGARWNETFTLASGAATPLVEAAELVRAAAGSSVPVETPGGALPAGEDASYAATPEAPGLGFDVRPLDEAVRLYVDWLRGYSAAESGSRA